eukprot:TRINITY_DN24257_c0_g1_i1.p1 TRINITY_DN24257_c0_g1~~TRINITY_DN24257_c0_g1_i1.p1  ORF type:complete len:134 (-),score=26.26 TRINITY_DN24257_c0_g1_i1:387-788(-)
MESWGSSMLAAEANVEVDVAKWTRRRRFDADGRAASGSSGAGVMATSVQKALIRQTRFNSQNMRIMASITMRVWTLQTDFAPLVVAMSGRKWYGVECKRIGKLHTLGSPDRYVWKAVVDAVTTINAKGEKKRF